MCVFAYLYMCISICLCVGSCVRARICVFACVGVVHARVLSGSSTFANNAGTSPTNYSSWEKVRKKTSLHYEEGRVSNSCLGKRNRNLTEGSDKHFNDGNKKRKSFKKWLLNYNGHNEMFTVRPGAQTQSDFIAFLPDFTRHIILSHGNKRISLVPCISFSQNKRPTTQLIMQLFESNSLLKRFEEIWLTSVEVSWIWRN